MATDQELKISRMTKRSLNKKIFGRANYKLREFVLTPFYIKYFDVSGGNRGKERGRIFLKNVKYVEKVQDDDLDGKKFVLQLAYVEDPAANTWFLLYIVASSSIERDDWISLIRFYTKERKATFLTRFHPGVWKRPGRYSCCDDINRRSSGCQITTDNGGGMVTASNDLLRRASLTQFPQEVINQITPTSPVITSMSTMPLQTVQTTPVTISNSLQCQQQQQQQINIAMPLPKVVMANSATPGQSVMLSPVQQQLLQHQQQHQQQQALLQQQQQKMAMFNAQGLQQHFVNIGGSTRVGLGSSGRFQNAQQQPSVDFDDPENTVIAVHNYNPVRENQLPLQKGEKYYVVNHSNAQWWYVRNMSGQAGYVPTNYIHKPNSLNSFDWYYKDITRQQAETILLEENREGCFLVRDSVSKKNTYTLSVTSKDPESLGKLRVHHYHIHRTEVGIQNLSNGHSNGGLTNGSPLATAATTTASTTTITNTSNGNGVSGAGVTNSGVVATGEAQFYLSEKHAFPTISDVIHYHKHNSGGLVVRLRSPPVKDRESPVTAGMGLDEFELDPAELQIDANPIGKGQFGVVKKGRFRNIPVAVKQMVENAMNEDDFIEEAKNMRFLNHPNLVQLFGVVLKKRPIMIITEYMKHGKSLFSK